MTGRVSGPLSRFRGLVKPWGSKAATLVVIGVVVAGTVVGVLFGDGVARTIVDISDGSTWLADDSRGQVVQVNPSTGKPEARVAVGQPGSDLDVRQRDGRLMVVNRRTGEVTSIDLATLLASGRRQVTAGDAAEVLLDKNRMYVVDRDKGTITNVDPASTQTIGEEWRSPTPLADAAVDGASRVWAIDKDGRLSEVAWSDDATRFVEQQQQRPVRGAGGGQSALVAHDRGVTVLGPDQGVVVQVDTGHDRAIAVPGLKTPLWAADASPADLVPAAVESSGTVIVVRADQVLEVRVTDIGCRKPTKPAVLHDLLYVPCSGARKVIVLDKDGRRARADIVTPEGGEPELVLDDGRLIVNVPGASTAVVVDHDGSTRTVDTKDPNGRVRDVDGRETPPPPPPPAQADTPAAPPPGQGPGNAVTVVTQPAVTAPPVTAPPAATPPPPPPPSTTRTTPTTTTVPPPPPTPEEVRPKSVTATARADGSVLVTWTPGPKRPERFQVLLNGTTPALVTQVPGTATSAVLTTVKPGTTGTFFVIGVPPGHPQGTGLPTSPASNAVTVFTRPGPPTSLTIVRANFEDGRLYVWVRWQPAEPNGRTVTAYRLVGRASNGETYRDDDAKLETFRRGALSRYACGSDCFLAGIKVEIEVTAVNEAGAGQPAKIEWEHEGVPRQRSGNGPIPVVPVAIPSLLSGLTGLIAGRRRRRKEASR
ncbi:hypothetical protein KIPE111705_39565 [Kibdelosporangium persicum]|uniref:Fibronectin type III domain-containing protein n=1 Tax=Kibdelosporangium persicum TaxID=2698649 RepID=A0ABX2FCY1_9PSEU|nr:hypothetical protein [Kibdelosporangium persicum]NRN68747.1 Fibronectin type III domain-containing protein [Kibdelosporangium persicum]